MEFFDELFMNRLLLASLCSWLTAQVLKTIIYAIVNRRIDWKRLTGDGGMPSGHSATVTALAVSAGMSYGFDSAIFAIACILAIIVMHDAMGVRREAGRHAKALNELFMLQTDVAPEDMLKEFLGHSPSQVLCGAVLGGIIALILS